MSTIIKAKVQSKEITLEGAPFIVCNNDDYVVQFEFDEAWENQGIKTARFVVTSGKETSNSDVVFTGNECPVPRMVGIDSLYIGVFAGDIISTTKTAIACKKSILCDTPVIPPPTPDCYEQILELFSNVQGASVWVRYSDQPDGEGFTEGWHEGQQYIGFLTAYTPSNAKGDYTWTYISSGPKGEKGDKGAKGDNCYIRYSAYEDGTSFHEGWRVNDRYIGFACKSYYPIDKLDFNWVPLDFSPSKLDKVVTGGSARVYYVNSNGEQEMRKAGSLALPENSILMRNSAGNCGIVDPQIDDHIANKRYVDKAVESVKSMIPVVSFTTEPNDAGGETVTFAVLKKFKIADGANGTSGYSKEYSFAPGMTWREWCDSSYNEPHYTSSNNKWAIDTMTPEGSDEIGPFPSFWPYSYSDTWMCVPVDPDAVIEAGKTYTCEGVSIV